MAEIKLTKKEAKEFIVNAQNLSGAKLPGGEKSILSVLNRLRLVQVDSISVAGANHDIVFNSRIRNFQSEQLERVLYDKKFAFESYAKGLCILPIESRPFFESNIKWMEEQYAKPLGDHKQTVKAILDRIKKSGPMSSADFKNSSDLPGIRPGDQRTIRMLTDILWATGRIVISHRKGRIRYFDIPKEKAGRSGERIDEKECQRHQALDRFKAMRLFKMSGGSAEPWAGVRSYRKEFHREFLDNGILLEVEIENCRWPYYILSEDIHFIDAKTRPDKHVRFLAPLDSMTWDRSFVKEVFDFECSFEVYKKKEHRKYGYYCLPILYGNDFVGRCDIAKDKDKNAMCVHSVHWEKGFKIYDDFLNAFAYELADYARFLGMESIRLPKGKFTGKEKLKKLISNR